MSRVDGKKMIKHIVLLAFKPEMSEEKIFCILQQMQALMTSIPQIKQFSSGKNCSPEGLNKDFTHGFIMTFESGIDRDIYLEHPEHKRIATEIVIPALVNGISSVLSFDFQY